MSSLPCLWAILVMARLWESDELSPGGVRCSQGHRPSTQVLYGHDRAICLECFSELITAPSSLGVHRAGALTEFQEALKDAKFCHSLLMQKRAHRLAAPLLEAICSTEDEVLSAALVEVIRDVCMLALDTDSTLLQEFLLHAWLQLSSNCSTIWGRGHRFRVSDSFAFMFNQPGDWGIDDFH